MIQIQQGNILRGSFWPEKVRVISAKTIGESQVKIEAVGLETHRFYNPILSDENKAFKGQAEFVAMGHPLLESVVNNILSRYAQSAGDGATFTDPDGRREGIIWFLQAEIRDGNKEDERRNNS
jgi:hypothetical protein